MKTKKIIKIIAGIVIFITLPTLLFFGYIYFKYNEELPHGLEGKKANELAIKMQSVLNKKAFDSTSVFEWTFKNRRHYIWEKSKNECEIYWKANKVKLNFHDTSQNQAFVHSFKLDGELADELILEASNYFKNDSFWVFAPFKAFDEGTKRELVKTSKGDALLVTYNAGDSYLWHFDETGKPISFKMWTDQLPVNGLESSWVDWTTTGTGVELPTFHKILFLGIEISDIKATK